MLTGNIVAITSGAIFAIVVSLCTRSSMTPEEVEAEWEKTRDIDNPLSPWVQVYMVRNPKLWMLHFSSLKSQARQNIDRSDGISSFSL